MLSTLAGQRPQSQAARRGRRTPLRRLLPVLIAAALGWGCEERPRPWSARPGGGVVTPPDAGARLPRTPASTQAGAPGASAAAHAGGGPPHGQPDPSAAAGEDDPDGAALGKARRSSRVGGLWVSCYGGFRPSADPLADVTRLGMLCGPPNGLGQLGDPRAGTLEANKPVSHRFQARTGACYRLFAAAAPPIEDLDVTVRSTRGSVLARDDSHDRWPIVEPERPFCSFEDAPFRVELHAPSAGRYALAIWQLPPPSPQTARGAAP